LEKKEGRERKGTGHDGMLVEGSIGKEETRREERKVEEG